MSKTCRDFRKPGIKKHEELQAQLCLFELEFYSNWNHHDLGFQHDRFGLGRLVFAGRLMRLQIREGADRLPSSWTCGGVQPSKPSIQP